MTRHWQRTLRFSAAVLALALGPASESVAQPWGSFFGTSPTFADTHGYVEIPHSAALNPTGAITIEAWVWEGTFGAGEDCRSIAGKNFLQAWWVGLCNVGGKRVLRSYLKGGASARNGGEIPANQWVHVAVTFDGSKRRHYVEGEQVAEFAESGPLTTSGSPLRFFSDVSWQFTPRGFIREVRLWNVARSLNGIRALINKNVTAPQGGLVGVWPLSTNAQNIVGPYDGAYGGAASSGIYSYSPGNACVPGPQAVCFDGRFQVNTSWRTNAGTTGVGTVVPGFSSDSANFWFFFAANWELLVKTVNGCGLNSRHWIFYAPVTDVHYKIIVYDAGKDVIRVFFGYQGLTQGATDTDAFDTCP
jgi:hypothetical protein